jgi:SdpI/YfhL protein family
METVNAKTAATLVCLGLILIGVSIPLLLGKIKMNYFYGFRIRKAFESEENWYEINSYGAKAMIRWSLVIIAAGIACLYRARCLIPRSTFRPASPVSIP